MSGEPQAGGTRAGGDQPGEGQPGEGQARTAGSREMEERRRRRARVFGDVLPDRTEDERPDAWGERDTSSEEWLRRQVPPHHG